MSKQIITKKEYYQAIGLIDLAKKKNQELRDIEKTLAETLGAEENRSGYYGHISDCVHGECYDIDTLLRKENIEVESS